MPARSSSTARRSSSTARCGARRLGISTIYQELSLVPHLSVAENIFLGKTPTRWPGIVDSRRMRQDARRILDRSRRRDRLRCAGAQPPARAAADGRGRAGAVGRGADPGDGRADLGAEPARSGAAVRHHRAGHVERRGRRLHLSPDGRGLPHRPSRHRPARRPSRGDARYRGRDGRRSWCGSWRIAK